MPATPGTSTTVTVNPAIGLTKSDTKDPFVGVEAGRTITEAPATQSGFAGEDTLSIKSK